MSHRGLLALGLRGGSMSGLLYYYNTYNISQINEVYVRTKGPILVLIHDTVNMNQDYD